jgi:Transmembrane Fragile-X-F protein
MAKKASGNVGLPSIAVLLTAVFTALRLTHRISWPWWWVLSPLWGLGGILALIFAGIVVTAGIDIYVRRKNRKEAAVGSSRRRRSPRSRPPE